MGVVAALRAEARTLCSAVRRTDGFLAIHDGMQVLVSGMGCAAAAVAATALADAGASALLSWGMAGGLDPALSSGTVCLPEGVISREGDFFGTDVRWRERVGAVITGRHPIVGGKLLTHPSPISDPAAKGVAFLETGAVVVDMESAGIAAVAAGRGLPFMAVRVVVDAAGDTVPGAVLAASHEGQVRIGRLMLGLVRSPQDIAPLIRLAQRYRSAMGALTAVARSGALAPLSPTAAARLA